MTEPRTGPSYGAILAIAIAASTVVSASMVIGLSRFAPNVLEPPTHAPTTVEVPNLVSVPRAAAGELLEGRGLRMLVESERPDANAALGSVATQRPLAGSDVDRGSSVSVVISTGAPMVTVPEVVGRPLADARASIERLGLTIDDVSETGQGAPGTVSSLDPAPGTSVAPGASIRIVAVAAGVEVPMLTRLDRRRAQAAIEAAGFVMGPFQWRFVDHREPFVVLEQSPAAGTRAPPGSTITLTLNQE